MNLQKLPLNLQQPHLQEPKFLKSGDRVWLLTDLVTYKTEYCDGGRSQTLFRVGIYDLRTRKVGLATFGKDIAHAMLVAGLSAPPWTGPQQHAIEIWRPPHKDGEKRGRYVTRVELLDLDTELSELLPVALRKLADHQPNSAPGMWSDLELAAAKERDICLAVSAQAGAFSAGDITQRLGDPNANVTSTLQKLVRHGKLLPPVGKKRWARYQVARHPEAARADWTS
jgi:hypothetical protein